MISFFQDLLEMFKNRVKNVFYSTFALSWILINWKFVFVLFASDKGPLEIFNDLELIYSKGGKWSCFLIYPFVFSLFHIFILSKLSEWLYIYWLGHIKRLSNAKKKIAGKILLSVQESRKLHFEYTEVKKEKDEMERKYEKRLEAMKMEYEERLEMTINKIDSKHDQIKRNENKSTFQDKSKENKTVRSKTTETSIKKREAVLKRKQEILNFEKILDEILESEFNILAKKHTKAMVSIYKEGGSKYNLKMYIKDSVDKVRNLDNIYSQRGFTFTIIEKKNEMSFMGVDQVLTSIEWDRSQFEECDLSSF